MEESPRPMPEEAPTQEPVPPEEELYAGTKIDSEDEALASEEAVEEALTVGGALPPEATDLQGIAYTLGMWRVEPGQKADFIAAWQQLSTLFSRLHLPPSGQGVLIQSVEEPDVFYSFGPWQNLTDIEAMRQDAGVQAALQELRGYCQEASTGIYRLVAESPS